MDDGEISTYSLYECGYFYNHIVTCVLTSLFKCNIRKGTFLAS